MRLRGPLTAPRCLLLGSACAAILFAPFPTTAVPEWKVQVVDGQGRALKGELVRQYWQDYSLESCCGGGSADARTDENGYVIFPRRSVWASLFSRVVNPPIAELMTLAHGSAGVHANVMVWGRDNNAVSVKYEPGEPLPDKIVSAH
jgi:hypothetical protein